MDDPRLDEILERLDAIESALYDHLHHHETHEHRHGRVGRHRHELRSRRGGNYSCEAWPDEGREGRGQPFEEKRVVDLIVRLVSRRVEQLFEQYASRLAPPDASGEHSVGPDEGGTPKR